MIFLEAVMEGGGIGGKEFEKFEEGSLTLKLSFESYLNPPKIQILSAKRPKPQRSP